MDGGRKEILLRSMYLPGGSDWFTNMLHNSLILNFSFRVSTIDHRQKELNFLSGINGRRLRLPNIVYFWNNGRQVPGLDRLHADISGYPGIRREA